MGLVSKTKDRWTVHWKKIILILIGVPLLVGIILILVALIRTAVVTHDGVLVPKVLSLENVELIDKSLIGKRSERLAGALKINTTSTAVNLQEYEGLLKMHTFLEKNFPLIHNTSFITREIINNYSLLYTVEGTVEGKLPYLLASHLDVVPADPAQWEIPPFSGRIINNTYIYGRGALDDKIGVMGIMEAIEYMLKNGKRPKRTFYCAFGHDEEIGGRAGALQIANALKARGVTRLDFVVDEGFPITIGMLKQTERPVAIIGITEKGYLDVELSVTGTPSHSSFPPKESSIGILGAAVTRLEANPHPAQLDGIEADTFKYMIPYMDFKNKFLYTNLWLFSGIVVDDLSEIPFTNAILRTTTATTIFNAGVKSNVVPPSAKALINHRVQPSHKGADVVAYDKKVINDDRVKIKVLSLTEALPPAPYDGDNDTQFQLVASSIRQIYPDTVVVPGVLIGNSDTRWYTSFTRHLFRFLPTVVTPVDAIRYHGNNERISIEHYHNAVNIFYRIIKNADLLIDTVPTNTNKGRS